MAGRYLVFPGSTSPGQVGEVVSIPLFDPSRDPEGAASHVPYMDHFYDNSLQTGLMRDLAIDLELLREHVVLLGNQGVGKNKIVDRYALVVYDYYRVQTVDMFTGCARQGCMFD